MPEWSWDESQSESGVVHQSTPNTDHDDATELKQGYDYANFSEIAPDPIACWPLHEDSGTTAYDVAGSNNGAYTGPSLGQTGLLGTTAASFDGIDDIVDIGNPAGITASDFGSSITSILWINFDDLNLAGGQQETACVHGSSGDNDDFRPLSNGITGSYDGIAGYVDGGDGGIFPTIDRINFSNGTWCMFAMRYDGSTATFSGYNGSGELYTDSVAYSQGELAGVGTGGWSIGGRLGTDQHIPADIASVFLFDTALTDTQIQTLYDVVDTDGTWTGTAKPL